MDFLNFAINYLRQALQAILNILEVISYLITNKKDIKLRISAIILIVAVVVLCLISWEMSFQDDNADESASLEAVQTDNIASTTDTTSLSTENYFEIGEIITFGSYEQDNNKANGAEPIEWIILAVDRNRVLVISKFALDQRQFHSQNTAVTWKDSDIREWLNDGFYNDAFTLSEQAMIDTVTVTADENSVYPSDVVIDTKDKIFLLSTKEAERYFQSNSDRVCYPTPYTRSHNDVWVDSQTGSIWWWLRTPGELPTDATTVNTDGRIDYKDGMVYSVTGTVRPAMWVYIEGLA